MHRAPVPDRPIAPPELPRDSTSATMAAEAAASPLLQALVAQFLRPRADPPLPADPPS